VNYAIRSDEHVGGIAERINLAALRLMINSNPVGCSIGRSAAFPPAIFYLTRGVDHNPWLWKFHADLEMFNQA
jgi:hypothetical protein